MKSTGSIIVILTLLILSLTTGFAGNKTLSQADLSGIWIGKVQSGTTHEFVTLSLQPVNGKYTMNLTCGLWFPQSVTIEDVEVSNNDVFFNFGTVDERGEYKDIEVSLTIAGNTMSGDWNSNAGDYGYLDMKTTRPDSPIITQDDKITGDGMQ